MRYAAIHFSIGLLVLLCVRSADGVDAVGRSQFVMRCQYDSFSPCDESEVGTMECFNL